MKKTLKGLFAVLLGVGITSSLVNLNTAAAAETTSNENVKELFKNYYNGSDYTKVSSIKFDETKLDELKTYFHAGATQLDRTTYYHGNELWMSRNDGKFSYYGSAANKGGVTNATATVSGVTPENARVALTGEGKESMEDYYVTMKDLMEDSFLANENTWTGETVYTTADKEIMDKFRLFTAPCFLNYEEDGDTLANYLTFTKATVEEKGSKLVLSLYVDGTDSGKVTGEADAKGDYLFSQAEITYSADLWDGVSVSSELSGEGNETNPYLINTGADLAYLSQEVNAGNTFADAYFKLTNNIDLNNIENFMIGNSSTNSFAGNFDGNNFAVRGINLKGTKFTGLFNQIINDAEIKNLSTYGNATSSDIYVGGIVGFLNYSSILNCKNFCNITTSSSGIGGISGSMNGDAYIEGCVNYGNISGGDTTHSIGGITGKSFTTTAAIFACLNYGNIYGNYSSSNNGVGGIIGTSNLTLSNCVNNGDVVGLKFTGGISGYVSAGTIINSVNNGKVSSSSERIGGIVGEMRGTAIDNSINNGNVSGVKYIGGITGTVGTTNITNCENNGDVISTNNASGGIVGSVLTKVTATIKDCENNGNISGSTEIGGLIGLNPSSSSTTIINSINNGNITGTSKVDGLVGNTNSTCTFDDLSKDNGTVIKA